MPEEEKKTVPIDTSGPDATIDIAEEKDEAVIEQPEESKEQESKEQETTEEKTTEEKKDSELEDYSRGVQARIGKLTRKLREAERREQAALDYAKGVEKSKTELESKFKKTDSDYIKKFETTISSGLEAAQKELAAAIESGNAQAQVEASLNLRVSFPILACTPLLYSSSLLSSCFSSNFVSLSFSYVLSVPSSFASGCSITASSFFSSISISAPGPDVSISTVFFSSSGIVILLC